MAQRCGQSRWSNNVLSISLPRIHIAIPARIEFIHERDVKQGAILSPGLFIDYDGDFYFKFVLLLYNYCMLYHLCYAVFKMCVI